MQQYKLARGFGKSGRRLVQRSRNNQPVKFSPSPSLPLSPSSALARVRNFYRIALVVCQPSFDRFVVSALALKQVCSERSAEAPTTNRISTHQIKLDTLLVAVQHHAQSPKNHIFTGAVAMSLTAFSLHSIAFPTVSTDWRSFLAQTVPASPDTLPPAQLPVNQGGEVNVPPVNPFEAEIPNLSTPTTPSFTLPPPIVPTQQTPAVRVPSLQPIPAQTPTPGTPSQSVEPQPESVSPASNTPPVIEFGQPLPKATPRSALPSIKSGAVV